MSEQEEVLILDEWETDRWTLRLAKPAGAIHRPRVEYRAQGRDGNYEWSPFWDIAREASHLARRLASLLEERKARAEGGVAPERPEEGA